MFKLTLRSIALALLYLMVFTGHAHAAINRVGGPHVLVNEPRALVRFDSAFDTINRIYLVVWGTQAAGPVNGMFLNEAGQRRHRRVRDLGGPHQSGWAA